jgi:hypothetical protein
MLDQCEPVRGFRATVPGMADDLAAARDPDDLPAIADDEVWLQADFEEALRSRSGRAPFGECMDTAAAVVAEHTAAGQDTGAPVDLAVVTVLGLALYAAGLAQYADAAPAARVEFEVHRIELDRALAALSDPELLELAPGHLAWPEGRVRGSWSNIVEQLRESDRDGQGERLRLHAAGALARVHDAAYVDRIADLLTVVSRWRTHGWYDSPSFPRLPSEDS